MTMQPLNYIRTGLLHCYMLPQKTLPGCSSMATLQRLWQGFQTSTSQWRTRSRDGRNTNKKARERLVEFHRCCGTVQTPKSWTCVWEEHVLLIVNISVYTYIIHMYIYIIMCIYINSIHTHTHIYMYIYIYVYIYITTHLFLDVPRGCYWRGFVHNPIMYKTPSNYLR